MLVECSLLEIRLNSAVISRPPGLEMQPGQYLSAAAPGDVIPHALFPIQSSLDWIEVVVPSGTGWQTGQVLRAHAPLGKGFQLPGSARRVAAASLDRSPARLLPLILAALEQGAEVALYANALPESLSEMVEVLPPELVREAWNWADYFALDCPTCRLDSLQQFSFPEGAGSASPVSWHATCACQVLVYAPFPCAGVADCGVCAVPTARGWKLACKEGPVFDLQELWA